MTRRSGKYYQLPMKFRLTLECGHKIKVRHVGPRKYFSCSICQKYRLTVIEKEEL